MMEFQIEMPIETAYNHLFQKLSNLGFIMQEIEASDSLNEPAQIVFSLTTHPTNANVEYFSLSADGRDSTTLKEVDLTGGRWLQSILHSWLGLDSKREFAEEWVYRRA